MMSLNAVVQEKRRSHSDVREDTLLKTRRNYSDVLIKSHRVQLETEKRSRREIANSNERRRMQSINVGFEALKKLLPPTQDGEKLSKANTLQLAAQYLESALIQLSILKEQLALYQQSGYRTKNHLTEIQNAIEVGFCQKRISNENDLSDTSKKLRKLTFGNNPTFLEYDDNATFGQSTESSPPISTRTFKVDSTSLSDETASNTAARLEHLVMAIEQIEGGRSFMPQQIISPLYLNQHDYSAKCLPSKLASVMNIYKCSHMETNQLNTGINHCNKELISRPLSSTSVTTGACADGLNNTKSLEKYQISSRPVGKPVLQKYLHRAQYVMDTSHNQIK